MFIPFVPYLRTRIRNTLLSICILLCCCHVNGQQKLLKFESYTKDDDLLHSYILSILQDDEGYVWVGSYGGLNRFDGTGFSSYSNRSRIAMPTNVIHDIYEPQHSTPKTLWFGTDNGLMMLHKPTMEFTHFPYDGEEIMSINEDDRGNLWLGSEHKGLLRFDMKTKTFGTTALTLTEHAQWGDKIKTIYKDHSGNLWIGGSNSGLVKYNTHTDSYQQFLIDSTASNPNHNSVNCIYEYQQHLLVGTSGAGLHVFDTERHTFQKLQFGEGADGYIFPHITGIAPDHEGDLWLATLGGGLYELKLRNDTAGQLTATGLQQFTKNNCGAFSISNNILEVLYKDHTGNFWIGTLGGGLTKLDFYNHKFDHYQIQADENSNPDGNSVLSVGKTANGDIWYGTQSDGIYTYSADLERKGHIPLRINANTSAVIRQIYRDKRGLMWIGVDGGLFLVSADSKRQRFFNLSEQGLAGGSIHALCVDRRNTLWFGVYEYGIYSVSLPEDPFDLSAPLDLSSRYENTYSKGNLSSNLIWAIYEDREGQIWAGTDKGLDLYDPRRNSFQQVLDQNTNCILESEKVTSNSLWIGTYGSGLFLLDKTTKKTLNFSTANGLSNNNINGILEDNNGNIWVGTEKGICSVDASGLYNIDVQTISLENSGNKRVHAYYIQDGLQGHEFHLNANEKLKGGKLLFGGPKGFNIFDPQNIIENAYVFPASITDIKIHNQSITTDTTIKRVPEYLDSISLEYKDNYITIEFSQVCLSNPEHAAYEYMLEGYDKDWIHSDDINGKITYTGLPEGDYVLKIKSINPDGFVSDDISTLAIHIAPPWYRTVWFLSLVFVTLVLGAITTYKRLTLRSQRRHEAALRLQQETFEKEKLQADIDYKNRELSSSAMYLLNRNEKLIEIRESIESSVRKTEGKTSTELNKIIDKIEAILKDKDNWESFEKNFNLIDTDFTKRLMEAYPALSNNDVKICTYMRMNLSSKEIAGLLNIVPKSLETSRLRIRKKMELESSIYLSDFILKF